VSQNALISPQAVLKGFFICCITVVLAACSSPASDSFALTAPAISSDEASGGRTTGLTVFAAASLTDAFREIGQAFEALYPGVQVTFNFAGSQRLALQIEQGAQADLFASADQRNMDKLVAAGLISLDAPVTFARNQMVVILPDENPGRVEALEDLARPGLKLLLAGEQVPVGAYARQVLGNLSGDTAFGPAFKDAVLRNLISNEENVKQVVAKIQLGEADVGIVYRSDVTPRLASKLRTIRIPDHYNVEAAYPMAILESGSDVALARQFVQFVLAPDGRHILERWGFIPAAGDE
jgi:molybdate transport system substrate-binding protein